MIKPHITPYINMTNPINIHTLTHTYTHSHTHTYTHTHTHIHTHIHTYTHTYIHTHTLTHTYTHSHIHTQQYVTITTPITTHTLTLTPYINMIYIKKNQNQPQHTSGAIQFGLPINVCRLPLDCALTPKSAILIKPSADSSVFAAFISLLLTEREGGIGSVRYCLCIIVHMHD